MTFDAGNAADGAAHAGTQSLMMDLLQEGTTSRSAEEIAIDQERLGAAISTASTTDTSTVSMSALTANLTPSLELMADIVRNPAFADSEVARVKDQRLAEIAQEQADPSGLAYRALGAAIYGPAHPYGSVGGTGEPAVIQALTPAALRNEHDTWLRADNARVTVVGNVTMAELLPQLEAAFGDWTGHASARPAKDLTAATPAPRRRLIVIDRPNSPQSVLLLARVLPLTGRQQGMEALDLANEVIGNGFLSRINADIRETRGWSYGLSGRITLAEQRSPYIVNAPVQALIDPHLVNLVREFRPHNPKWPGLIIEVTEDEAVKEFTAVSEAAVQLRIYGVTLAIDDFGSGYSSFARLKQFPFNEIKLDRSFVQNCASDTMNASICQSIVDLARAAGATCVAEGIENKDDWDALIRLGCNFGQGFLFGRPMSVGKLIERTARQG